MSRIVSIVGSRPNLVKVAALDRALRDAGFDHAIVDTLQHSTSAMRDSFIEQLGIRNVLHGASRIHPTRHSRMGLWVNELGNYLSSLSPCAVLVYGDTDSSLAGATASTLAGIPVGHVEAGLRSGDFTMPEERNRIAVDGMSRWLFAPDTTTALKLKGFTWPHQHVSDPGNVMIDTLARVLPAVREEADRHDWGQFFLATFHRPSLVDDRRKLIRVMKELGDICLERKVAAFIPGHPRTLASLGKDYRPPLGVIIAEPVQYMTMIGLIYRSEFVVTDSGGVQEEALYLGKRCFTLRSSTERPITIRCGSNRLLGAEPEGLRLIGHHLDETRKVSLPWNWDGHASERIVQTLTESLQG